MKTKSLPLIALSLFVLLTFGIHALAETNSSAPASPGKTVKKTTKGKNTKTAKSNQDDDQIHVSADALVSNRNANYAEFQGNVVTTQKGSVMNSDRLKIFYSQDPKSKDPNKRGAIEKIVATGHVKIDMEDKTAWSDTAVYTKTDDTILLSGGNPRIMSGKSYLSGEIIKINRKTQEVFVNNVNSTFPSDDNKPKKRVEMNIFTNDPNLK
jgi:lipopolysaccharide transport protein LptA